MFISEGRKPYFVMSSVMHEIYQALKDTMEDEPILYNGVIKIHAHGFLIETDILDARSSDKDQKDKDLLSSSIAYIDNHAFHAMKRWAAEVAALDGEADFFSGSSISYGLRYGVMALSRFTKPGLASLITGREAIEYRKSEYGDGSVNVTAFLWSRDPIRGVGIENQITVGQELILGTLNDCHLHIKDRVDKGLLIEVPEYDTFESQELNELISEGFTAEQIFNFDHTGLPCVVTEAISLAVTRMAAQAQEETASPR